MEKKENIIIIICISMLFILCGLIFNKDDDEVFVANLETTTTTTTTTTTKEVVWDNLTVDELTFKLDKNLYSTLSGKGIYFAMYTKETGMDPYLAVSIVNHETGCKWGCSKLVRECNNIGGIKGKPSCGGGSYKKYDSLEDGIRSYLDLVYYNYYSKGLDTAVKMNPKYAQSSSWADRVNAYYQEIVES